MSWLKCLAIFGMGRGVEHLKDLFKCYAMRIYVDLTDVVRNINLLLVVSIALLIIFINGFLMLNIALFLALPWSLDQKIILMACLSGFYCLVAVIAILILHSKETWLRITGLKKFIDDVSRD